MDAHFDNQIQARGQRAPVLMAFRGPARQFGSGGIGAFAMRMGRVALPLMKKYVMPVAKQFGKNLISTVVPEISSVISGKKRPRAVLKETFTKSAAKTVAGCIKGAPTATTASNKPKKSSGSGAAAAVPASGGRAGDGRAGAPQRRNREMQANQLESFQSQSSSREVGQTYSLVFRLQPTTTTTQSSQQHKRIYGFKHIFGDIE